MLELVIGVALLAQSQAAGSAPNQTLRAPRLRRPNIVVIVADDFGVDLLDSYAEGFDPPCTPNIDGLAADGMLFRNAWANPACTTTRAATLTGRHGFRTGIGTPGIGGTLSLNEFILPEMLPEYTTTCVGKWHLSANQQPLHPNASGFDHFAGSLGFGLADYYTWTKVIDGQVSTSTTYATTDTTDEAIAAITRMPEPWFTWVAFNAPHTPYHEPPSSLCSASPCPDTWCSTLPTNPSNLDLGNAMIEAMDTEIGRLLAVLEVVDPNAMVIFIGDNGTAGQLSQAPFLPSHAKGTVYEGGVNVPLIVRGPGVMQAECDGLVSCVDLFATLAEIAHSSAGTEDSVSMVPYFRNPTQSIRDTVYTERFSPNGGAPPFADHHRAIREQRYKLIRKTGSPDEFYDLESDPFETWNLLPNLTTGEQAVYESLVAELSSLGVG